MPGKKTDNKPIVRALKKHALSKSGATVCRYCFDPNKPDIEIRSRLSWPSFANLSEEGILCVPIHHARLQELRKDHKKIKGVEAADRDGHTYMGVPFGSAPLDVLKSFVDEAYKLVWDKLPGSDQLMLDLAAQPYDEAKILDALITCHGLKVHRTAIRKLLRPSIIFRTSKASDAKLPVGAMKIGGSPDLPAEAEWPCFKDGRPLAFLAQFDLAVIAALKPNIQGLPKEGLLSLFSAWGWVSEDECDPDVPDYGRKQPGWTVSLHTRARVQKERRKAPRGVNSFKVGAAEPIHVMSLPEAYEPSVAKLRLPRKARENFDALEQDFRMMQLRHWLEHDDPFSGCHRLGGYGRYQQEFPSELKSGKLTMLIQLGSDDTIGMAWGDGGELTFCVDAGALAKGRIVPLWGTCQGG